MPIVLIRDMPDVMYEAIQKLAKEELRSVNKEILILLNEALINRKNKGNSNYG